MTIQLSIAPGQHQGVGTFAFGSWEEAIAALLRLGEREQVPVVVDEFGHVIEADPSVPSIVAAALGPGGRRGGGGRARLILCGSAIAMMRALTSGEAPLRGRAGMELVMHPADFRQTPAWLPPGIGAALAARLYAVIGGVVGYATDMVDFDLPGTLEDFDRWVCQRVLSPASTLHHEATTLLAEEPTLSAASPATHHAILATIANGSVTAGAIASRLGRPVSNLDPALKRLVSAGFVVRGEDPIRAQRPVYRLADPFLQFHYAVLEPHGALLRDRETMRAWDSRLRATFDSRVRGPVFEEQARTWVRRYASPETIGGDPAHVGVSAVRVDNVERQLDVVVSSDAHEPTPAARHITAIGEAKSGETVGLAHLSTLEKARAALGVRAASAKLLLFAPTFEERLVKVADSRGDVELVDYERLYHGD